MADTQTAPSVPQGPIAAEESIDAAHNAILGLLDSAEEQPKAEEEQPSEEEESTEETQDESLEEVSEEEEESEDEASEEEEESEESEEEDDDKDALYEVRGDGEDHEVTLDELVKGYSRQSDYTKKTQALAASREEAELAKSQYDAALPELQHLKQQYVDALGQVINNSMAGLERFNIDWETLKEDDREEYLLKREEFRQAQESIQRTQHQRNQEAANMQREADAAHQQMVQAEQAKLVKLVPEWGEADTRQSLAIEIRDYALSQGFTKEEISSLVDSRSFVALMKAMKYDALSNTKIKAKKIKNKPKVVRSGTGTKRKEEAKSKRNAQMKRLNETGHVDDSVSLFEDFVEL